MVRFLGECMEMQGRMYARRRWDKSNNMSDLVNEKAHYVIYQKLRDRNLEGVVSLLRNDITLF